MISISRSAPEDRSPTDRFEVRSRAKNGAYKSPDFVGCTRGGDLVVVECKGTQRSWEYQLKQIKKGRAQKINVTFGGGATVAASLVAGIYVPIEGRGHARLYFVDPPAFSSDEPAELLAPWIVRYHLAGVLGLVGAYATQAALFDDRRLGGALDADLQRVGRGGRLRRVVTHRLDGSRSVAVGIVIEEYMLGVLRQAPFPLAACERLLHAADGGIVGTLFEPSDGTQTRLDSPLGFRMWVEWEGGTTRAND